MKWTATTIVSFLAGTSIVPTVTAINGIRARASTHHDEKELAVEFSKRLLQPVNEDMMSISTAAVDAAADLAAAIVEYNDDGQLSVGSAMEEAKSWFGNIDNNVADVDILDLDINLIVNIDKGTEGEEDEDVTVTSSSTTSTNVCPLGGLPLPGTPEGEECVSTQAGDKNKDCNSETPIALGETICGISSTYFNEGGSARSDIDRFRFTVDASTNSVSINLKASFQASVSLSSNGDLGEPPSETDKCVLVFLTGAEASGIGPSDITAVADSLLPGDYTLEVSVRTMPATTTPVITNLDCAGGNEGLYTLTLTDTTIV